MTPLYRFRYAIVAAAAAGSLGVVIWRHESRRTQGDPEPSWAASAVSGESLAPSLLEVAPNVRPVAAEFDGPPLPGGGHAAKIVQPAVPKLLLERRPLADAFPPSDTSPAPLGAPARQMAEHNSPFAAALDRGASTRLPATDEPENVVESGQAVETERSVPTFRIDIAKSRKQSPAPWRGSPMTDATAMPDVAPTAIPGVSPTAMPGMNRSPGFDRAMAAVSQQADEHTAAGFRLASKGAFYAARAEMIQALRLIAQALDARKAEQFHSQSLAAGLRAIKEAADFAPRGARLEADLNVVSIAATHRTPVLSGQSSVVDASALAARQAYYTFAQEQLAKAAGGVPAGSNALYGLGRIHQTLADRETDAMDINQPAAMVCHQAALLVEPRNYMAANELGVLLARAGQLDGAKRMLQLSLRARNQAATWKNLAAVEALRGDHELSRQAASQASLLARHAPPEPLAKSNIEWVKSSEFARQNGRESVGAPPAALRSRGLR